ncbi:PR-1-like protein [Mycena filopes]|nr:PR-1-like protein [Mycena filopes]
MALKATTTKSCAPTVFNSSAGVDDNDTKFSATFIELHNVERAAHGAANLTWNRELANDAAVCAHQCVDEHSGGRFTVNRHPVGENIAAGTGAYSIVQVMGDFVDGPNEKPSYNSLDPKGSHWTQIVWQGTTQLGCARTTCNFMSPPFNGQDALFYVCEYYPAGNIQGDFG